MKIIPIKELRDTTKISELVKNTNEPIFVTKNGYEDLVILSPSQYEGLNTAKIKGERSNKKVLLKESDNAYLRTELSSFESKLSDVNYNLQKIKEEIDKAVDNKVDILSFRKLTLVGNSLKDLYLSKDLLVSSNRAIEELTDYSKNKNIIINVGSLLKDDDRLYDAMFTLFNGEILGITINSEKSNYFSSELDHETTRFLNRDIKISSLLKFVSTEDKNLSFAVASSIEEVLFNLNELKDTNLIIICSSVIEEVGVKEEVESSLLTIANKLACSVEFISDGTSESTQDNLYLTKSYIIDENKIRRTNKDSEISSLIYDLDLELIRNRKLDKNFKIEHNNSPIYIGFNKNEREVLDRDIEQFPFINFKESKKETFEIIDMIARSLVRRMKAIRTDKVVLGLSGGLDSTFAILIAKRAMDILNLPSTNIISITMPSVGTTSLTHSNAYKLAKVVGSTYLDISIEEAVKVHLKDIKHEDDNYNNAFENAQARERTQILLDYANDKKALMLGTGDLSELCLGWCTYAGDHISMYGLNGSLPKTLIQEMTKVYGETHSEYKEVLDSILDTPISPELLPLKSKDIEQKTESFVGPYELNDFFIYHLLKDRFSLEKTYDLCKLAFKDKYDNHTIKVWLKRFVKRFFQSQFKRSCLPEGIEVKGVSISPRTSLIIPSEIEIENFISIVENLDN